MEPTRRVRQPGIEYCTDSSGTPAFVEIGDLRSRSYSDFESSASNVIKLLQPKRDGFVPHVLAQHVAQAVTGAENETEVVGIYTDVDGSVEYDVTEPETIPFGATWQQNRLPATSTKALTRPSSSLCLLKHYRKHWSGLKS